MIHVHAHAYPALRQYQGARKRTPLRITHPHRTFMIYIELGIVSGLIILNSLLAMAELAVVSSPTARLRAHRGRRCRLAPCGRAPIRSR
jgi:hypothetical protein